MKKKAKGAVARPAGDLAEVLGLERLLGALVISAALPDLLDTSVWTAEVAAENQAPVRELPDRSLPEKTKFAMLVGFQWRRRELKTAQALGKRPIGH